MIDGMSDEGLGETVCGLGICVDDCDDTNPDVNPGADEEFCDGIDNDCDLSTSPQKMANVSYFPDL